MKLIQQLSYFKFSGDAVIDGIIGSSSWGINELNINTDDEQDTSEGVKITGIPVEKFMLIPANFKIMQH
ncbi:MAG: hypothetical protein R2837_10195 [Aliarcobacter sp.]